MELYLTFDDGIQEGTEEVLKILKSFGVRGTFFLVGIHLDYEFKKNQQRFMKILGDIYENHAIGNHSFSHANYQYSDFYDNNGVVIDNVGKRRSVFLDFEKSRININKYLKRIATPDLNNISPILAVNQKKPLARLPGRNTWFISTKVNPNNPNGLNIYKKCELNTESYAKELYMAGNEVFGWNIEWPMNFEFQKNIVSNVQELTKKGIYDFQDDISLICDLEVFSLDNVTKDRLTEKWTDIKFKILNSFTEKVIVLMHDRAFRNEGYLQNKNLIVEKSVHESTAELASFINYFKDKAVFKTLDDFNTENSG